MASNSTFSGGLHHPLIWLGVIAGTLFTLIVIKAVWWLSLPLVISVVICYLSRPLLVALKRRGMSLEQSLLVYLALGFIAITPGVLLLFPWLASILFDIQEGLPRYWDRITGLPLSLVDELEGNYPVFAEAGLRSQVVTMLNTLQERLIAEWLPSGAILVLSCIPSLLLVPYLAFFILKDGARLKQLILRGVPNAYFEKVMLLFHNLDMKMKDYFRGLMAMTFLDTLTLAMGLWLIGLPFGAFGPGKAFVLGLVSGVLSWVPYVGTATACVIVLLVCVSEVPGNWLLVGGALALFVAVRVVDDFLFTPITVGRSVKSHPLLTVLIIFAAGFFGGLLGMLLVMPVLGVWMAFGDIFGQVWLDDRLRARHRLGKELRTRQARVGLPPAL